MGRNLTEFQLGARIFYIWLLQTAALIICLLIAAMIIDAYGGWFTTAELRMALAGTVIGHTVSSYRLIKKKVRWNERAAELELQIRELRARNDELNLSSLAGPRT